MSRCTGHCCRDFAIPVTPGALRMLALAARAGRGRPTEDGRYHSPIRSTTSGRNFVFGSREEAILVGEMAQFSGNFDLENQPKFRCSNLTDAGDCGIYDSRPEMCRGYPYDHRQCQFVGCTLAVVDQPSTDALQPASTSSVPEGSP